MIQIENISKTYEKDDTRIKALDSINLSASKGEFVVVKGSSGCGKTTLLLTAGGLLHPDAGNVFINDYDIYKLSFPLRLM